MRSLLKLKFKGRDGKIRLLSIRIARSKARKVLDLLHSEVIDVFEHTPVVSFWPVEKKALEEAVKNGK